MATIYQSFYPAVPDSHLGRYTEDVSPVSSSSLLGSEFFPDELSDSAAFGGLGLLQDVSCYPPTSSCDFSSVGAADIPDLGNLLWDTEGLGSLRESEFMYTPNECVTSFGQSMESPLTSSSPVSPASLPSFPSSLSPSPLPAYSTPSPSIPEYNLSPVLSPASFVEYSSPASFPSSASPVESPPAPKRSRSLPESRSKKPTRVARKERKKEQNKTAAIRYRQKKKEEADVMFQRQQELERKNKRLHRQADSMLAEIGYLKKLWQDVCAKRQQLK